MSTTTGKSPGKAGPFRVIEGGLAKAEASAPMPTAGQLPGQLEAERLRRAILLLEVPGTGLTVPQVLDEVQALYHDTEVHKIERAAFLLSAAENLGLRFNTANPDLELAREGFFNLTWPERLLDAHPELAGLHPKAHPFLLLG